MFLGKRDLPVTILGSSGAILCPIEQWVNLCRYLAFICVVIATVICEIGFPNPCCSVSTLNHYSLHSLQSVAESGAPHITDSQALLRPATTRAGGSGMRVTLKCGLLSIFNPAKVLCLFSKDKSIPRRERGCPLTFGDSCFISCCA